MWRRQQRPNERILEFATLLKQMAPECKYKAQEDEMLRDIFICNLLDEEVSRELMSSNCRSYEETVEKAKGLEASNLVRRESGWMTEVLHITREVI